MSPLVDDPLSSENGIVVMHGAVQVGYEALLAGVGATGTARVPEFAVHLRRTSVACVTGELFWTKATCEPSNESVTEVTTVPPVLKAQYVEGIVPHRPPLLATYKLLKATTEACVVEPARLVLNTTKSLQLAVPASNENFAGKLPAPTVAPVPMFILQSPRRMWESESQLPSAP